MDESFLPPPSLMAGTDDGGALCVVHRHEGEVKILLESEYALTVKLVEAGTASAAGGVRSEGGDLTETDGADGGDPTAETVGGSGDWSNSGSQSPERLRSLCRVLLLHAQFVYHDHRTEKERLRFWKAAVEAALQRGDHPRRPAGHATKKTEAAGVDSSSSSPRILRECVGLGVKMILEGKVRSSLAVSCLSGYVLGQTSFRHGLQCRSI